MQVDPEKPVLVAGDPERTHEVKVVSDGGIWYHDNLIDALVGVYIIKFGLLHKYGIIICDLLWENQPFAI